MRVWFPEEVRGKGNEVTEFWATFCGENEKSPDEFSTGDYLYGVLRLNTFGFLIRMVGRHHLSLTTILTLNLPLVLSQNEQVHLGRHGHRN